jgi:hypothetical protein
LLATNHDHIGVHRADWLLPSHEGLRPLRYLSCRLDAALNGLDPGAMHLHNLLVAYFVARVWGLGAVAGTRTALFGLGGAWLLALLFIVTTLVPAWRER